MKRIVLLASVICAVGCGGSAATGELTRRAPAAGAAVDSTSRLEKSAFDAMQAEDWSSADKSFAELRRIDPRNANAVSNHGVVLEHLGDLDTARAAHAEARRLEPDNAEFVLAESRVTARSGDTERALALVEAGLDRSPDHVGLRLLNAALLRESGKPELAVASAQRALLRAPTTYRAVAILARSYIDLDQPMQAATVLRAALAEAPDEASLRVELGRVLESRGDTIEALGQFERAVQIDDTYASGWTNIGALALRFRDYTKALDAYRRARESGASTCEAWAGTGYAYEGLSEGELAIENLEQALERCPADTELLYSLGTVAMTLLGDQERALGYFERYVRARPELAGDHPVRMTIEALKSNRENAEPQESR
ncbi:MAG: tetratricopeptide repeat protein [Myxococcota bacterium]